MEIATSGSALSALRAFSASCCPHNERKTGGGCCPNALTFPMTPLSANEEFSHEIAAGFLFSEEMKIVEKIKQLNDFCSQAVVLLSDNIQRTTVHENMTRVIPDVLMDALVDIMDVILELNHLHDTKSSLRNDFSVFKSYDQVTYLLLKHCVTHVENDTCTTPCYLFKFIRVLSYLLVVLEGSDVWKKTGTLPGADKKIIEAFMLARVLQNPKTDETMPEKGLPTHSPHLDYEHIMKHNFSDMEWQAMADIIYGVKSVVQILREFQLKIAKCVRRTVYHRVQAFVQHTLLPILHRADKRKLTCTKLLHDIRAMCGDWVDSELLASDFKKKRKERKFSQIPDRTASPSLCQVLMLRTAVDSMYAKRSMGDLNGKTSTSSALFSFKKDLDRR
ncbi:hypothetical protein BBO99_00004108 [Phytophthora kernoviae]|uniref:Uncharacterized protein n=2 Tax=Phytophthora kernoviae TaxID=325452 RepID=A0A421ET44_9STRA|nr:hypothetical protein G195_004737 [Phytophthora kernoviae 00238/432]KAG2526388.1 hypothetical protein JM16_003844 [Phytophthora kernoviae]KAG2527921.1 hypothetical protein JM18_003475 [Phytophthora kernoviae]RLM96914.1 hypothetical protein BBI17_004264 [Phytophthora kernoviae]RLN80986.1 hypothetical protein BBO99_00004108 [Phytophthora kernoviae]